MGLRAEPWQTEKAHGVAGIPVMIDDFTSGIDHLEKRGIIDPRRVGLIGHSNGGYAANLLITHSLILRCAVISPYERTTALFARRLGAQ